MLGTRFLLRTVANSEKIRNIFVNFAILQTYLNIRGHMKICHDYVVGDLTDDSKLWPAHFLGFRLGQYTRILLSGVKGGKFSPEVVNNIKSLGLDCIWMNYDTILSAASTYVRLHGRSKVLYYFKVPIDNPEWPPETWGMPLGRLMVTMFTNNDHSFVKKKLVELGILDVKRSRKEYAVCLKAMKVFKSIHGKEPIDRRFVVPLDDDRYDPEARGLTLGRWVEIMRLKQEKWPERKEELEQMGVNFNVNRIKRAKIDVIFAALTNFYTIHGHLKIPQRYAVPFEDPMYPEEAWGLKIGRYLRYYREGGYVKYSDRLSDYLVKPLHAGASNLSFQQLYDALVVYRMIHGHLDMANSYVIPSDDQRYPEEVRGACLGVVLRKARATYTRPQHKAALLALGLDLATRKSTYTSFDKAFACLKAYKKIHGHLDMFVTYQVPANDPQYPEGAAGFYLGRLVANIRLRGYYKKHREQLEALGLSYEPVDRRLQYMNKVVTALTTYQRLHGSLDVDMQFIIAADDSEYPEETRGLRLGAVVYSYKTGRLKNKYRDRLQQMGLEQKRIGLNNETA